MAGVFRTRGATALVYRGDDGIDKMTTTGHTHVWEVTMGEVREHDIDSRELGIVESRVEDLLGEGPEHNAQLARDVLAAKPGAVRDIVALNAAAGLVAFALAVDPAERDRSLLERLGEKLEVAYATIDSGAATRKLGEWVATSQAV
jgi:anthranilate phosphoribosyltransferase